MRWLKREYIRKCKAALFLGIAAVKTLRARSFLINGSAAARHRHKPRSAQIRVCRFIPPYTLESDESAVVHG